MATAADTFLYGYVPSRAVGYVYVVIFALTSLLHAWQAARSRAWWLIPSVLVASIGELVGWLARLQSSFDPTNKNPFTIQTILLVLAPTPLVAALFIGFGRIVDRMGSQYSRLKPSLYSKIFLTCDITSLLIQGLGGGICASSTTNPSRIRLGSNIVLGGLIFQIVCMSIFGLLTIEYALRCSKDRPFRKVAPSTLVSQFVFDTNMKRLVGGICAATVLVYIRSVYRIIEFVEGFDGGLAHNQVTFIIFDATLVALSLVALNVCHPGRLLARVPPNAGQTMPLADNNSDKV